MPKSKKEIQLDYYLDLYYQRFNVNYPIMITGSYSSDRIISEIKRALEIGERVEPPILDDDKVY